MSPMAAKLGPRGKKLTTLYYANFLSSPSLAGSRLGSGPPRDRKCENEIFFALQAPKLNFLTNQGGKSTKVDIKANPGDKFYH